MSRLNEHIEKYKILTTPPSMLTHRERAELETEIWSLVPAAERRVDGASQGRGVWLARAIGGTRLDYDIRCNLMTWGDVVDVLWERVEADMTLSTAIDILRSAKKRPGEMAEAVLGALAEYDARPNTTKLPDGKVIRKKALTSLPDRRGGGSGVGRDRRAEKERRRASSGAGETIWARVRGELGGHIAERLGDLDPRIGEEIYRDFERDLNLLLGEYQDKINRIRTRAGAEIKVSRRLVIDACAVLALDPPSPGKAADLGAARKQRGRLAKVYHPDANGGDESMRPQYERVIQAYERLDDYNAAIGRKVSEKNGAAVVASPGVVVNENEENDHGGSGGTGDV